ncbi:MAG: hypothetical protein ACM3X7_07305 [Solirubrobacterales bacterium]
MERNILDTIVFSKDGQEKIKMGLIIILLSPLIGSLLFFIYSIFVGYLIGEANAASIFFFSCILIVAFTGIALVIIGCNDKAIEQGKNGIRKLR